MSSQRLLLIDGLTLLGLCCASLLGDCLCFGRPSSLYVVPNKYLRALTDNFIHGLVSALATSFFFGCSPPSLLLVGFVAGSFIDIDHFIQIRSLSMTRVLDSHAPGRPFLHNSLLLLLITFVAVCVESVLSRPHYPLYSMIFCLAWSTHHLRDAQRHGLNFLPLGETPPIDYYIPITCLLLVVIKLVLMLVPVERLPSPKESIV